MGLLSRAGRQGFRAAAGREMGRRLSTYEADAFAPLSQAAIGGLAGAPIGGLVGGLAGGEDGAATGVAAGLALGAGAGGAQALARFGGGAARAGMRGMRSEIAGVNEMKQSLLARVGQDPGVAQRIVAARDMDELGQIVDELMQAGVL